MTNLELIKEKIKDMDAKDLAIFMTCASFTIQGFKPKEVEIAVESLEKQGYIQSFIERLEQMAEGE